MNVRYVRTVVATKPNRVKARSKRGWTTPSPATVAAAERARAALEDKKKREEEKRARREEWLFNNAKDRPMAEREGWLDEMKADYPLKIRVLDRLAKL